MVKMEVWISQNWAQILTILLLIGSWIYHVGVTMGRLKSLETQMTTVNDNVESIDTKITVHTSHHAVHLSEAFLKMLDDRHLSITTDIRETKAGVHRIEQFLMGKSNETR